MNENRPSREKVQAEVLTTTVVAEHHLGSSLRTFLKESGASRKVQDGAEHFVQPVLERLRKTEDLVLAFARPPVKFDELAPFNAVSALLTRLEEFARDFVTEAITPEQATRASAFQRFIEGVTMAWEGREKEPELEM